MTQIKYPKVLVIGNKINLKDGAGITFFNLFKDWPKEKMLVAATSIDHDGIALCEKYYRIGYDEYKRPWPLNKFQPYYQSEEVIVSEQTVDGVDMNEYKIKESKYNSKIKNIVTRLLHYSGFYYYLFPLNVSRKLLDWIEVEKPDIVYTQLGLTEHIFFVEKLMKRISQPLVIHIMDDWIKSLSQGGLAHVYWNWKVKKSFFNVLRRSSELMSICQGMSDEYKKRYGLNFTPYQNCIDPVFWGSHQKTNWKVKGAFSILYAGRIGVGTSESVMQMARSVEELGESGLDIQFEVQCPEIPEKFKIELKSMKHIKINSFLPYEELPRKFSSADLLVLPMDFDRKNLRYIRLSMPTKVPEYMISGTPILVFAPSDTALSQYATNQKWGHTVNEKNKEHLKTALKQLATNEKLRERYAKKAIKLANIEHAAEVISKKFAKQLSSIKPINPKS